jgi:hypothetical protein
MALPAQRSSSALASGSGPTALPSLTTAGGDFFFFFFS